MIMHTVVQLISAYDAAAAAAKAEADHHTKALWHASEMLRLRVEDLACYWSGSTADGVRQLHDVWDARRDLDRSLANLKAARNTRSHPPQLRLVALDAYDQRAELAADGYRYDAAAQWHDPVGMHASGGWLLRIWLDTPSAIDRATAAIERAKARGRIEGESAVNLISLAARTAVVTP